MPIVVILDGFILLRRLVLGCCPAAWIELVVRRRPRWAFWHACRMRGLRRHAGGAAAHAATILLLAAYPALLRKAYAPGFASAAGVARFVLVRWAVTFAVFHWLNPRVKARALRWEAATDELAEQLGRWATPEEFLEHWRCTQAAWKAAGRPR